ncbi:uncharacterized protein LOC121854557 [Homarus americanus]|nr:uncharacterized protein LOC121854557 [Homarus americanus]
MKGDEMKYLRKPSLDHICYDAPNQYMCANCKTLVNCVDGRAHATQCNTGNFCYNYNNEFGGHVCYPGRPTQCLCQDSNVFYRDAYDQGAFFICDESGENRMHQCPEGDWFDEKAVECRSFSGLPRCTTPGTFAHAEDCTRYYSCIVTTHGWLQHEYQCPYDRGVLFYNEQTGSCEDPCFWEKPRFECTQEGRFGDPTDCRRFYVCTWDAVAHKYRQVLRQCPSGFEWQQIVRNGSGRCTTMVTEDCIPVTNTRCIVPEGLCN